jgi:hypothetical protein
MLDCPPGCTCKVIEEKSDRSNGAQTGFPGRTPDALPLSYCPMGGADRIRTGDHLVTSEVTPISLPQSSGQHEGWPGKIECGEK